MTRALAFLSALFALVWIAPASALDAPADPAARQIVIFHEALLDSMKQAKTLGVAGRYRKLKPVIEQTFDFPVMTTSAVGASFSTLSATDQRALIDAFARMTIATYAHDFDGYSGERFTMNPDVPVRGDHKLVQTTLVTSTEKHDFNYVMHPAAGRWKVIDILLDGYVSQIATKRSEYAATVSQGGAKALVTRLDQISDNLLGGYQR